MRSWLTFMLLLTGFATPTVAQEVTIGVEGNFGLYSMWSLKETQRLPANYPIPFKSVQNFPASPGARVVALVKLNDVVTIGIFGGLAKTGSRLTYSDLTGQAYRDVIVSGTYVGSYNRFSFFTRGPWSAHGRFSVGTILNNIGFEKRVHLEDSQYEPIENSEWRSTNFFVDLGVEGGHSWRRFYIKTFVSYETGFSSDATLKHGSENYPANRNFTVDWDGLRLGFGLEYWITKPKS